MIYGFSLFSFKQYSIKFLFIMQNKKFKTEHEPLLSQSIYDQNNNEIADSGDSLMGFSRLFLSEWGLPPEVIAFYRDKKIVTLFEWQAECLSMPNVLDENRNLVFSAPTSAGKSLVADILLCKTICQLKKKAIIILPYVAVTHERVQELKQMFRFVNIDGEAIEVEAFAGASHSSGELDNVHVCVCTIERANNMINRLIEANELSKIGIIIIDELHMLADPRRGCLIELLLMKLLHIQKTTDHIQIVGMSATIPNLPEIASWLDAQQYDTLFRPVPLTEKIVWKDQINELQNGKWIKGQNIDVTYMTHLGITCPNPALIISAIRTVLDGYSVLIFCLTKNECEQLSEKIAETIRCFRKYYLLKRTANQAKRNNEIFKIGQQIYDIFSIKNGGKLDKDLSALIGILQKISIEIDASMDKIIRNGVAFHHAGLSTEERTLIENAFRTNTIRIMCCTSTLSAGVNLPARRVILSSPYMYKEAGKCLLDLATYQQMIGRAGRKGIDDQGESILFCALESDFKLVKNLLNSKLSQIKSCLLEVSKVNSQPNSSPNIRLTPTFKRAILEVIANGTVNNKKDLRSYLECSLFLKTNSLSSQQLSDLIEQVLEELRENTLIYLNDEERKECLIISKKGKAIVSTGFDIDEGLFVYDELEKGRHSLSCLGLHQVYLVTPSYVANQLYGSSAFWENYFKNILSNLDEDSKTVATSVGVNLDSGYHAHLLYNVIPQSKSLFKTAKILLRFCASLILNELMQEVPLMVISKKYIMPKGKIQDIHQAATTFAYQLTTFCECLIGHSFTDSWRALRGIIKPFRSRFSFEVEQELADIKQIDILTSSLARHLYNHGYDLLETIAEKSTSEIAQALRLFNSFENENQSLETIQIYIPKFDVFEQNQHKRYRKPINELAKLIQQQARELIKFKEARSRQTVQSKASKVQTQIVNCSSNSPPEKSRNGDSGIFDSQPIDGYNFKPRVSEICGDSPNKETDISEDAMRPQNDPTSRILIEEYQLIEVKDDKDCQMMLEEIFPLATRNSHEILDIAIHSNFHFLKNSFCSNSYTKLKKQKGKLPFENDLNPNALQVYGCYSMQLSELYFARLNHRRIFLFNSRSSLQYLQTKLSYRMLLLDPVLEGFDSAANTPASTTEQKFRFYTYEVRKILYLLEHVFHISKYALMHRIDWHDLSVAIWLLEPENQEFDIDKLTLRELKEVVTNFLPSEQKYFENVEFLFYRQKNIPNYMNFLKTALLFDSSSKFCQELEAQNLYKTYKEIEVPSRLIIYSLQTHEKKINTEYLENEKTRLVHCMDFIKNKINDEVKEGKQLTDDDLVSPEKVVELLGKADLLHYYEVIKPRPIPSSKKQNGFSTNKMAMIKLQQKCGASTNLPTLIMEWRRLNHLYNSIISIQEMDKNKLGSIYGHFSMWTATGRIQMHDPNLINLDRDFEVTTINQQTAQLLEKPNMKADPSSQSSLCSPTDSRAITPVNFRIRQCLIAPNNCILISADYCQLELRILAHFSNDEQLLAMLNDQTADVFKSIASKWKDMPIENVDEEMREQAKQICYGIIYGMGADMLADQLSTHCGTTLKEAKEFRKSFLSFYSKIDRFIQSIRKKCSDDKFVTTLSNRRRYLLNINSLDSSERSEYERRAVNTRIQGTAADIIKLAMLAMDQAMESNGYRNDAALIMQMHDELMYQVRDEGSLVPNFVQLLREQMEAVSRLLKVSLPVKVCSGPNWGELKEI